MGDQNFQKIFKSNLQEFIDEAFKLVPNTATKKRELVQCIKYSLICKNPQSTFLWKEDDISSSDFHDFYDEYDNKSEQQLIEEVTKDIKTEETKWFLSLSLFFIVSLFFLFLRILNIIMSHQKRFSRISFILHFHLFPLFSVI